MCSSSGGYRIGHKVFVSWHVSTDGGVDPVRATCSRRASDKSFTSGSVTSRWKHTSYVRTRLDDDCANCRSGGIVQLTSVRILLVDDFAPWRQAVLSILLAKPELQVAGEASDGAEAVQKAVELKPDLILLDISLPTLNGIEAARQIFKLVPKCKIIFLSQESSDDVMQEALSTGAQGYVIKSHAGSDLLETLESVLGTSSEQCQLGSLDGKPSEAAIQAN